MPAALFKLTDVPISVHIVPPTALPTLFTLKLQVSYNVMI
jgi:hypothetical protein